MLECLAIVLREARKSVGKRQVHAAAAADVDQSTIARFEKGEGGWPRDPGTLVEAYAVIARADPDDLWDAAIERHRQNGNHS